MRISAAELRPLFTQFARERLGAERFGDFCQRVLLPAAAAIPATAPKSVPAQS